MYYFTMLQMEERAGEILSNIFQSTEYFKKILKNKNINIKVLDFIIRLASLGNINYKKYFLDKGILDLLFNLINEEEEVIIKVINIISEFYSNFNFKNMEKKYQEEINKKMVEVLLKNYEKLYTLGCGALMSTILKKITNKNTNNDNDLTDDQVSILRGELSINKSECIYLNNLEENSEENKNPRKNEEQEGGNDEDKDGKEHDQKKNMEKNEENDNNDEKKLEEKKNPRKNKEQEGGNDEDKKENDPKKMNKLTKEDKRKLNTKKVICDLVGLILDVD